MQFTYLPRLHLPSVTDEVVSDIVSNPILLAWPKRPTSNKRNKGVGLGVGGGIPYVGHKENYYRDLPAGGVSAVCTVRIEYSFAVVMDVYAIAYTVRINLRTTWVLPLPNPVSFSPPNSHCVITYWFKRVFWWRWRWRLKGWQCISLAPTPNWMGWVHYKHQRHRKHKPKSHRKHQRHQTIRNQIEFKNS